MVLNPYLNYFGFPIVDSNSRPTQNMNPSVIFLMIVSVFSTPMPKHQGPQGPPISSTPLVLISNDSTEWQTCQCDWLRISWNKNTCGGSCDAIGVCNQFGSRGVTVGFRQGCDIVQQLVG